jgi:hypothetical protein
MVASSKRNWTVRLLVVGAILVAYYLGTLRPSVQLHSGEAHSAEGAITLEADGWSYNVPLDGLMWRSVSGVLNMNGRPDCLPPTGTTERVRFGAVEMTIDGTTWRPVVWVDCRPQ